jgi:poly(hydroxyalkanoate) depolymerase family esterase
LGAPARARDEDVIDVEARVVGAAAARPVRGESFIAGHFWNECGARDYKLFEPARDGRALPLVVMLHGCTQDPDDFARGTRMNALGRAQGALVLYPAQSRRGNAQRCWNWFKHNHQARGKGEPAILAGMVREVMATHDVDPTRVYVAGLSAGGAMAAILGDAYPDLFAAVGVHSGLPTGSATDVQSAFAAMGGGAQPLRRGTQQGVTPPTIVFHGDADATVNVVNGERVLQAAGLWPRPDVQRASTASGLAYSRRVHVDAARGRPRVGGRRPGGLLHRSAWAGCECRDAALLPAASDEIARRRRVSPRAVAESTPAKRAPRQRGSATSRGMTDQLASPRCVSRCSRQNTSSSAPITIRVHHALSEPSKVIRVWINPSISTPHSVPATRPMPPDSSVPPITTEAIASSSRPVACRP